MKYLIRTNHGKTVIYPIIVDYIDNEMVLLLSEKYVYHTKMSLADYEQIIDLIMGNGNRKDGLDLFSTFDYVFELNWGDFNE